MKQDIERGKNMLSKSLLNLDLKYLNPFIDFLNEWYVQIILLLVAAGLIYAIILGVNLAKSDNSDKRDMAKKRIVNASFTVIIVVVLTLILQFVLSHLDEWVNGDQDNYNLATLSLSYVDNGNENDLGIDFNFDSNIYTYYINVPSDKTTVYISAQAEEPSCDVSITVPAMAQGTSNIITNVAVTITTLSKIDITVSKTNSDNTVTKTVYILYLTKVAP